jgi:hypothetical protein
MARIDEGFDSPFTIRRMRKRGTARHHVSAII